MKKHQFLGKRPTRQDAHTYRIDGFYTAGMKPWSTDAERITELKRIHAELVLITKKHFPRTAALEYAVLKCHLIVENVLTEYIRFCSHVYLPPESVKFGFAQKVEIAHLLGYGIYNPTLLPSIELLNRIRNQAAHRFEVDRQLVDELLQINHEDYKEYRPKTDKERITGLRHFCRMTCEFTAGFINGTYAATSQLQPEF